VTTRTWPYGTQKNRQVENLHSLFNGVPVPDTVRAEVERAKKPPHLFDQIEIWSRTDDPMAVGVIGGAKPRYFSIVRWGDAELTLAQMKRKLRVEKWILSLTWIAGISFFARCRNVHRAEIGSLEFTAHEMKDAVG
jgi:hypothetical protein